MISELFMMSVLVHVEGLSSFGNISTNFTFYTRIHVLGLNMVPHQGFVWTCIITILTLPVIV